MITTGIIRRININSKSYIANKYLVELNIFQVPGDNNKANYTYEANCSTLPGHYSSYEIGDKVYIGFINEDLSIPIILGKIYQGNDNKSRSQIMCQGLKVSDSVELPKNIKIGDISYKQLFSNINREIKIYFRHVITCEVDNGMRCKFKLITSAKNFELGDGDAIAKLAAEVIRLNADCRMLCDLYIFDSGDEDYIFDDCAILAPDPSTESLKIAIDGSDHFITSILSDNCVEV